MMTKNSHQLQTVCGLGKGVVPLALGTAWCADDTSSFRVFDAFLAGGGNFIDTARMYGKGEVEALIGRWLDSRRVRDQVVICTKVAHGTPPRSLSEREFALTVEQEVDASISALGVDFIDILLLHRDHSQVRVRTMLEVLNREVDRGRVRVIGASNWSYQRIDEALAFARQKQIASFAVVSNNLSLPVPTTPFYPGLVSAHGSGEAWHVRTQVPLLAWSSQARGFLGRSDWDRRDGTIRQSAFEQRMIEVYCTDENFQRRERATTLGVARGYSAMEVGLAWVMNHPAPVLPVVGPRNTAELDSCFQALSLKLDEKERRWLALDSDIEPFAL